MSKLAPIEVRGQKEYLGTEWTAAKYRKKC